MPSILAKFGQIPLLFTKNGKMSYNFAQSTGSSMSCRKVVGFLNSASFEMNNTALHTFCIRLASSGELCNKLILAKFGQIPLLFTKNGKMSYNFAHSTGSLMSSRKFVVFLN
jgi:type I site-specific restriction endonuclease